VSIYLQAASRTAILTYVFEGKHSILTFPLHEPHWLLDSQLLHDLVCRDTCFEYPVDIREEVDGAKGTPNNEMLPIGRELC
jgi:hypothetical protein